MKWKERIKKSTACIMAAVILMSCPGSGYLRETSDVSAAAETETGGIQETEILIKETESEKVVETQQETEAETEDIAETEASQQTETSQQTEKEVIEETQTEEVLIKETETSETQLQETEQAETQLSEHEQEETEEITEGTDVKQLCTCMSDSDDPFEHDPDCGFFTHGLLEYCDCGCDSDNLEEHDEECMCRKLLQQLEEDADLIELYSKDLSPSGVPVASAQGWKKVSPGYLFSSDYSPVKFYKGISEVQAFSNSDAVVRGTLSSGNTYLYPQKEGLGGSFGFIYKKVLYQNYKWYDLKITVVNYTTTVKCDNSKTVKSYPFISAASGSIAWHFNQALGGLVTKCEFLESGTNTKAAVNTRFQWWDIDAAQRFGIRQEDGAINGKYYFEGSEIYVHSNQTVMGIPQMELVVGKGLDASPTDAKYCAAYELNSCSTYYMSFGERDHMENDDYTYSLSHVESFNKALAGGTFPANENAEYLLQTDTTLSIIDTPKPEKYVSEDGKSWGNECALKNSNTSYWYKITQFVPWQDSAAYYESFVLKDQLPAGVHFQGEAGVICEENGNDVTDYFVISENEGTLTISAKSSALASGGFYGYHYGVLFKVAMVKEEVAPQRDQNRLIYTVKNTAKLIYKHKSLGDYTEKESNEVITTAELVRQEAPLPKKGIDGEENLTEKTMEMQEDEVLFSVFQEIPENDSMFYPVQITMEDCLEECLEYTRMEIQIRKKNETEYIRAENWELNREGQTVTAKGTVDSIYNGGQLRFQIYCKMKKNINMQKWKTGQPDGGIWIVVPNKAAVSFGWKDEAPEKRETNIAQVKIRENHIRLVKEIDAESIVWAHGNPTFTFRVFGKDIKGKEHEYFQTVVFRNENTPEEGKVHLEADFIVPLGIYTASEEKTMRYQLENIFGVENGTGNEGQVLFDLSEGKDGKAYFYNVKITDGEEGHTDFVKNSIMIHTENK